MMVKNLSFWGIPHNAKWRIENIDLNGEVAASRGSTFLKPTSEKGFFLGFWLNTNQTGTRVDLRLDSTTFKYNFGDLQAREWYEPNGTFPYITMNDGETPSYYFQFTPMPMIPYKERIGMVVFNEDTSAAVVRGVLRRLVFEVE